MAGVVGVKRSWPTHASDWKDAALIGRKLLRFACVNILEQLGSGCDLARGDVDVHVDFVGTRPIGPPGLADSVEADRFNLEARQRARRHIRRLCLGDSANNRE